MSTHSESVERMYAARQALAEAEQRRGQGDLVGARKLCEGLLREHPGYYGALHTLGLVCADQQDLTSALSFLAQADAASPNNWQTVVALASVYLQLGARVMATETLERAFRLNTEDPSLLVTAGEVAREERDYEASAAFFQRAVATAPQWRTAKVGLAQALENLGRYTESAAVLEGLVRNGDRSLEVVSALSMLPNGATSVDLQDLLNHVQKGQGHGDWEVAHEFVRARIADRAGNHEEAWDRLLTANALVASKYRQERERQRLWQRETLEYLRTRRGIPEDQAALDPETPVSLFILGPSRSGKTTIESIVAQSLEVKRGYENAVATNAVRRALQQSGFVSATQYPLLPVELEAATRANYIDELGTRVGQHRVLTNTSPSRIHDASRMVEILPNVRFLFVQRDRVDLAFRIFAKLYKTGNFYAYDIADVLEHIDWYYSCIAEVIAKYPSHARIVSYEDALRDPDSVARMVGDLCGIDPIDIRPEHYPAGDIGSGHSYKRYISGQS